MTFCSIYVQSQFIAFHRWEQAPQEVGFLASWHRHIFKVRVDLQVLHNDRGLEFFLVQKDLNASLDLWREKKVYKSCEMFCEDIFEALSPKYPSLFRVEVSEDGENGAVILRNFPSAGPTPLFPFPKTSE